MAVSTSEKEVVFMGYDYILLLAFLVDVGLIQSFRIQSGSCNAVAMTTRADATAIRRLQVFANNGFRL